MSSIDPNAVAAGALAEIGKSFFQEMAKTSLNFLSGKYQYLFEDFNEYLSRTYLKCNEIKIIIDKGRHYDLDKIYVKSLYSCGSDQFDDEYLIQCARDSSRLIVTGFGGIGKTIFTKRLWTTIFKEPGGKVPIFFELRHLNLLTETNILASVRHSLSSFNHSLDESVFNEFVEDGRFIFILDGFDELPESKRDAVEDQILMIANKCSRCGLVVSSRIDDRFHSWERFKIYKALPFNKTQVKQLFSNVEFESAVKKKFVTQIVEKRFEKYQSFLETPLLALMMLMTFSQSGEVPDKRSVFYKYAFLTLYSWHDGSKEAFRRESKTGLDIDQFEKVFSIFCLLSYVEFDYQIERVKFLDILERCKSYVDFDFDKEKFLNEVIESVNLMYKEGDTFIFTHRSFQEYFTAHACVNYFQSKLSELSDRLVRGSESVLSLMNDINEDVVDRYILMPEVERNINELRSLTRITDVDEFHKKCKLIFYLEYIRRNKKYFISSYGCMCNHPNLLTWIKIRDLKAEAYREVVGDVEEDSPSFGKRNTDELIQSVNTDLVLSRNPDRYVVLKYDYSTKKLEYKTGDGERFLRYTFLSGAESGTGVAEWGGRPSRWAQNIMTQYKVLSVFVLKRLELSVVKIKDRDKSIDEILRI